MHPTKFSGRIYVEKTPEQCCLGCHNSQKIWEGAWWDKHSSNGLHDQQTEAKISWKKLYNVRNPPETRGGGERFIENPREGNTVANCSWDQSNTIISPRILAENQYSSLFLVFFFFFIYARLFDSSSHLYKFIVLRQLILGPYNWCRLWEFHFIYTPSRRMLKDV